MHACNTCIPCKSMGPELSHLHASTASRRAADRLTNCRVEPEHFPVVFGLNYRRNGVPTTSYLVQRQGSCTHTHARRQVSGQGDSVPTHILAMPSRDVEHDLDKKWYTGLCQAHERRRLVIAETPSAALLISSLARRHVGLTGLRHQVFEGRRGAGVTLP